MPPQRRRQQTEAKKGLSCEVLAGFCDELLETHSYDDWKGAVNGLQVDSGRPVRKIGATVDATLSTIQLAVDADVDLLLVHHGLFWQPTFPWTGKRKALIKLLVESDLGVYSAHLPLDAHPQLGNNAQLGKALKLGKGRPFFPHHGKPIGLRYQARIGRDQLASRLTGALDGQPPVSIPAGPEICQKVGIITGGAGSDLKKAADQGIDTFITGEGPHWTFALAEELGINVFYGGHYATETFGVKALAAKLAAKFQLEWEFLPYPTHL